MTKPQYSDVEEMSDEKFMVLREVALRRDVERYGREFVVAAWEHTYEYRGVKYDIRMFRYMASDGSHRFGMSESGKWFVLEHPDETRDLIGMCSGAYDEHLYRDTMHIWNDGQTLEEMFDEVVEFAKRDIDELLAIRDLNLEVK